MILICEHMWQSSDVFVNTMCFLRFSLSKHKVSSISNALISHKTEKLCSHSPKLSYQTMCFLIRENAELFVSLLKLVDTIGRGNYLSSILFTFSFFWRPKNYWKKVFFFFSFISTRKFIMKSDLTLIKFDNHMCVERNWWVILKIRLPKIVILCQVKKKLLRIWNWAENFRTRLDVMLKSEYFV